MLCTILIFLIVLLDQITKFLAISFLKGQGTVPFIPYLLSFHYHENRGAAWGMLADQRWVFMILSTVAIVAIIAFLIYTRKEKKSLLLLISLSFFCGGGIGNMIDRTLSGFVVDFLNFEFIDFPIFNVADSFISVGAVLMVLYLILDTVKEYKENNEGWL